MVGNDIIEREGCYLGLREREKRWKIPSGDLNLGPKAFSLPEFEIAP